MKLRSIVPARTTVLAAVAAFGVVALAACGSDAASDAATMVPVTTTTPAGEVTTTTPPGGVATTSVDSTAVVTTVVSTTAVATTAVVTTAVATTAVVTTIAPTTTPATVAAAPPCDLAMIVEQTDTGYDGITPTSVRCAGSWASWVGQPDDALAQDGFFAVATWTGAAWELANLGTAGICGDGGVPADLWDALGCVE